MFAHPDKGQATPLYLMAVVGLLFLALVFFTFGQADVKRSGAQSAADSAALAAAREARDRFGDEFLENILTPGYLEDVLGGEMVGGEGECDVATASYFASLNNADVQSCVEVAGGRWGFTVKVISQDPMGVSIVTGTAGERAKAEATALIESRCVFETRGGDEKADGSNEDEDESKGAPVSLGEIVCDDKTWSIDPEDAERFPDVSDLFAVRLADG